MCLCSFFSRFSSFLLLSLDTHMMAHDLGRLFFVVLRLTVDLYMVWRYLHPHPPQLGLTPAPLLDWWVGGWVDGCFEFNLFFSLQCRFPHPFPTVGQTGWAPLIFNEKNRKYVVLNWKHPHSLQPTTSAAIHQIIPWLGCLLFLNNVFAPSQRLPNSPLAWPTYSATLL